MNSSFLTALMLACCTANAAEPVKRETNLLIVGGTESGWAAAMQAARMGESSITLVNDTAWLGGQYTSEAVSALDENRGVGNQVPFPRSGLFLELTREFEKFNREKYGHAQPGNAWTARTTIRPAEGQQVFQRMLEPYVRSGQVTVFEHYVPVEVVMDETVNRVRQVRFTSTRGEPDLLLEAKLTIDASDWGDIVKLSGAAWEFGPDLKERYQEPSAPTDREKYPLTDMNPLTWCLVIEETGREQVIPKPPHYDERRYFLTSNATKDEYLALQWPHRPHRPFNPPWLPRTQTFYQGEQTVYSQRRLVDSYDLKLKDPAQRDVILLNWSIQDYPLEHLPGHVQAALEQNEPGASKKNIVQMTAAQREIVFEDVKNHSLGMLYHLQTTVHDRMADKSHSFRRFRLTDEFGTPDRLPPKPYIRESLRLRAMYMMREQDGRNFDRRDQFARVMYEDGIGCWQFVYDFHPTGRAYVAGEPGGPAWDIWIKPGRGWDTLSDRSLFPLRSLIPEATNGLIGSQKNLGFSSIVSSAVRLQDQCVLLAQSAGATAVVALRHQIEPREIVFNRALMREVREAICRTENQEPVMLWPFRDLEPEHPAFCAINLCAAEGLLPLYRGEVNFQPDQPATPEWVEAVVARTATRRQWRKPPAVPELPLSRGEFLRQWWERVGSLPAGTIARLRPDDADGDGIPDAADPQYLDSNNTDFPTRPTPPLSPANNGLLEPVPERYQPLAGGVRLFNFAGAEVPKAEGYETDSGQPFTMERGFGWGRDLSLNHRRRGLFPDIPRDTFLFTREADRWECASPAGWYLVTVCVGDSGHEQFDQRLAVEGHLLMDDVTTPAGQYLEKSIAVEVRDGRLTLDLGQKDRTRNTCLNWLRIVALKAAPAGR